MTDRVMKSGCELMADLIEKGRREIRQIEQQIALINALREQLQQQAEPDVEAIASADRQLADAEAELAAARLSQDTLEGDFTFFCS